MSKHMKVVLLLDVVVDDYDLEKQEAQEMHGQLLDDLLTEDVTQGILDAVTMYNPNVQALAVLDTREATKLRPIGGLAKLDPEKEGWR